MAQIVAISIKEAFLLDEVDKHQAVEHARGIAFAVALGLNALDRFKKGFALLLEARVKLLGDAVGAEILPRARGDLAEARFFYFTFRSHMIAVSGKQPMLFSLLLASRIALSRP